MPITLRTPRLLLREWRDDDLDPFVAIASDPEVMAMLPPLPDRAACAAWIARMRGHQEAHGFAYWAVELPGECALVGAIGLSCVNFAHAFGQAVEVGWRLARRYWGHGYATEAARSAIEDGFYRLRLAEIVAFTAPANRLSRAVMERLGMTRDLAGDFDFHGVPEGHALRRAVLYRLPRPAA